MAASITTLARRLLPDLQSGLVRVAGQVNGLTRDLFASLGRIADRGIVAAIFADSARSLATFRPALPQPLVEALAVLTKVAASFLPRLASAASDAARAFAAFVENAAQTGRIADFIKRGSRRRRRSGRCWLASWACSRSCEISPSRPPAEAR